MLQNRSLLPKVEVLSHKGDKTSICCNKLLQLVENFYPCSNDENAPHPPCEHKCHLQYLYPQAQASMINILSIHE